MRTDGTGRVRVGISGSYGGLNLGDEAILQVIVAELRRSRPAEITVFSRDAEDTRRRQMNPGSSFVRAARKDLAAAYSALGKPEQAAEFAPDAGAPP